MKPVKSQSCNAVLRGGAPHIPDLHIKRESDGVFVTVSSYWAPSSEELAELNAGGRVEICVLGNTHPPISVRTEQP